MLLHPYILAIGFVTPAFAIAGVALASIPIIIHILNRRRYRIVEWAAMNFLLGAMKKNRRRIRFEQWLLLAVRCCVLGLLGIALARPLACGQQGLAGLATRSGLHVIIIDNSYSMAYESERPDAKTNLDQAKRIAKGIIERLASGGESVEIITAAAPASDVFPKPIYDLVAAHSAVDRVEQSYSNTDLSGAFQKALEIGREESRQPNKQLYILSDSTRSAWDTRDATALANTGRELAKYFRVTHYNLSKPNSFNQAVLDVRPTGKLLRSRFDNEMVTLARGFGRAGAPATVQWRMDNQNLPDSGKSIELAADTGPQNQPLPRSNQGGLHVVTVGLSPSDRLPADDQRSRVVDVAAEMKVLIVEGERGSRPMQGSGALLGIAMAPLAPPAGSSSPTTGPSDSDSYVAPELISDLELNNKILSDYRAIVLAGVGSIQPQTADQLKQFVQQGGTLMIFMGEAVSGENYNATLLQRGLLPGPLVKRMSATGDEGAFYFDFNPHGNVHPMLGIFRNVENSGLGNAQVYTYWQADVPNDPNLRVLNYLPAGSQANASTQPTRATSMPAAAGTKLDPAITVQDVGAGRVVWVSTTANDEWTSLPGKPVYVALVHELLSGSVRSGDDWMNLLVGQELEVPASMRLTTTPTLKDPQQADVVLEQSAGRDGAATYKSRPLAKPGLYSLSTGSRTIPVSVNVPSDEADIRPVDDAAIRAALGGIDLNFETESLPPIAADRARGNDYGWSIMMIVLVLVGAECFLAMMFGHYRR